MSIASAPLTVQAARAEETPVYHRIGQIVAKQDREESISLRWNRVTERLINEPNAALIGYYTWPVLASYAFDPVTSKICFVHVCMSIVMAENVLKKSRS